MSLGEEQIHKWWASEGQGSEKGKDVFIQAVHCGPQHEPAQSQLAQGKMVCTNKNICLSVSAAFSSAHLPMYPSAYFIPASYSLFPLVKLAHFCSDNVLLHWRGNTVSTFCILYSPLDKWIEESKTFRDRASEKQSHKCNAMANRNRKTQTELLKKFVYLNFGGRLVSLFSGLGFFFQRKHKYMLGHYRKWLEEFIQ